MSIGIHAPLADAQSADSLRLTQAQALCIFHDPSAPSGLSDCHGTSNNTRNRPT